MTERALEIKGLSYRYDHHPILSDINATVAKGEFVSIIGPNGAGKSTLVKCINRVLDGWQGSIHLFGNSVRSLNQKRLATLVGYVPQSDGRSIPFTVKEFLLMGRYPYLSPFSTVTSEDRKVVSEVLGRTGIAHLADRELNCLSGGERQIALIAAALVQGAQILLLDEPTASLDYRHQVECMDLLKRLNDELGVTLIAVTHDINHALALGTRVLALKHGRVCFDGRASDLLTGDGLLDIYETRFATYQTEGSDLPLLAPTRA